MEGTYWLWKHDWRFRSNRNRPVSCSSSAVHRSITRQLALIPQRLIRCMRLIGYLQSLLSLAVARLQPTLPIRVLSSTSSRLCPDEHDGAAGYRQRVKHRQEAPSAQHFSLPVENSPFRGQIRFGAVTSLTFPSKTAFCTWWRSLIGRSTGFELAAFEYARYQLLCWGAGGGYRKIWQARNYEHGLEQPIHRCCLNHDFDQGQLYNLNAFRWFYKSAAGNKWAGPLSGQHLYRTAVAVAETGARLSVWNRRRFQTKQIMNA